MNQFSTEIKRRPQQRYFMLDMMRIVCALAIFCRHAQTMAGFSFGIVINNLSIGMTNIIMTCFFILSGFSLFMSNSKYDLFSKESIFVFYKKRIISIIPLYFFVHFAWIAFYETDVIKNLWLMPIELLGIQTMFPVVFGVIHNGGTWFISCIIIAYLVYPYIQELIKFIPQDKRIYAAILMIAFISYLPAISNLYGLGSLYTNPLLRILEFATGAVLSSARKEKSLEKENQKSIVALLVVGFAAIALILAYSKGITLLLHFQTFFVCIAIFASTYITFPILDNNKVLQYASKLTYHFYILQLFLWVPSLALVNYFNLGQWKWDFLIALGLLIIMCIAVHELYEKPVQKRLKKLFKI